MLSYTPIRNQENLFSRVARKPRNQVQDSLPWFVLRLVFPNRIRTWRLARCSWSLTRRHERDSPGWNQDRHDWRQCTLVKRHSPKPNRLASTCCWSRLRFRLHRWRTGSYEMAGFHFQWHPSKSMGFNRVRNWQGLLWTRHKRFTKFNWQISLGANGLSLIDRLKMCINLLFDPDLWRPNPEIMHLIEIEKQLQDEHDLADDFPVETDWLFQTAQLSPTIRFLVRTNIFRFLTFHCFQIIQDS